MTFTMMTFVIPPALPLKGRTALETTFSRNRLQLLFLLFPLFIFGFVFFFPLVRCKLLYYYIKETTALLFHFLLLPFFLSGLMPCPIYLIHL